MEEIYIREVCSNCSKVSCKMKIRTVKTGENELTTLCYDFKPKHTRKKVQNNG